MISAIVDGALGFAPLRDIVFLAGWPLEHRLTQAVRKLAERRPELFGRLGRFRTAVYILSPNELPFAFRLMPDATQATVRIVPAKSPGPSSVRISGPLATLIGLFDGSCDADSSFFSRAIVVEGATDAAMALHNTLEAAELKPSDILGLPSPLSGSFDALTGILLPRLAHVG
ncbi:ubiquinone anaerobic biosynthesis accessory factor UbiT [Asticcacaulis sp. AC460]|uniref:ubiquinone anaerobic biosynthesis accessory factor UbiT n=1 Tax=Asticcacaulis sp. AC460 TaxID=1282360 RepID=UPI00138AD4AF|nr:SCP2 sterol-binding domain-containing protein [Asticcacaulis sp. AC460]